MINLNGLYKYPVRIYINKENKEYFLSISCENFTDLKECKTESEKRDENNINMINIVESIINEVLT